MGFDDSYYKKIIYKKNAFDDLKTYLKLNYCNKKILLVSTKSVPAEDVTELLNSVFKCSDCVRHFISKNSFCVNELMLLKRALAQETYDLIIAFGGGKCCDVVKYFSSIVGCPYIVCPTVATSLAFFCNYCINPFDSSKSFYAQMPRKIFIQESIIKKSDCLTNIGGLCFLHSLRSIFVEGVISDIERERHIFLGVEKLFKKLEDEETSILICNEDSNLVLMDLFIDFGFFVSMLRLDDYYLINVIATFMRISESAHGKYVGRNMLVCAKLILVIFKNFLEVNSFKDLEKPNYKKVVKIIKNHRIFVKKIKNNMYFCDLIERMGLKREIYQKKETIYKIVNIQLLKISDFCKKVKTVYKFGIELDDEFDNFVNAVAIAPFAMGGYKFVDFIAGSGILNSFLSV